MKSIEFKFRNLKPLTVNKAYKNVTIRGRSRRAKTTEAVNFEKRIVANTLLVKPSIFEFETHYSVYENFLSGDIRLYLPRAKLLTQKGSVSSTSIDLDNTLKFIIDGTFKRFEKINDAAICHINTFKLLSPDNNYHIYFGLIKRDLSDLEEYTDNFF